MLNIRQISPELAEKARTQLNEVEARIPQDIATLREWIEKQPHLKSRTNDQFLLAFLRGCKYSLEKAKQKIDYFHAFRSISPDIFLNNQVSEKSMKLTRLGHLIPLPKPLKPDGPRIVLTRYDGIDLNEFSYIELFKNQLRINNIMMLEDDNCVIGGIINIIDMTHVTLGFLLKFDPVVGKKLGVFSDKAMPFRVAGIHFINFPHEAITFMKMVQHLMPKKILDRMTIHLTTESLYEHVPKEYLPEEYGGNNGRISDCIETIEELMVKYKPYFEEDDQYKTDEKLRVGTKVSSESLFGLDGSFRKLEVD
ncbi:alpha-tocopherol transfer protein-like [Episyrphus balteatus]|uniref:alpha-tocopherol transfer protein-like n=1 Tax=Episyrphus balteatus TaxID=286459 RepID=UPI002484DCF3|nr:alpha-tocopherol transfer protein-like [Episyrphus balteatus]